MERRLEEPFRHRTWGYVAMGERRFQDAVAEFRAEISRRDPMCGTCGLPELARAYNGLGNPIRSLQSWNATSKCLTCGVSSTGCRRAGRCVQAPG